MTEGPLEIVHLRWLARSFGNPRYLPLSDEDLEVLARSADLVETRAGEAVYREGEPAEAAFLIRQGELELRQGSEDGPWVVGRVRSGAVIGDVEMFVRRGYYATALCTEDLTAIRFPRERIVG